MKNPVLQYATKQVNPEFNVPAGILFTTNEFALKKTEGFVIEGYPVGSPDVTDNILFE